MAKPKKNVILITLEFDNQLPVTIVAPEDWGDNIVDVARHLGEELNDEDKTFVAINNKVLRRAHIESALIKSRSIN